MLSSTPGTFDYYPGFNYAWEDSLSAPGIIALSDYVKDVYRKNGYKKILRVLSNPIDTARFRFARRGNGKAICLGRIQDRKQQQQIANLLKGTVAVDFVGPNDSSFGFAKLPFVENETAKYLGSWTRSEVCRRLTEYSCLVHLPVSEVAAPLVVLEALAAGISVVTNRASSANLTNEPFITILPDDENNPEVVGKAVSDAIARNASLRNEIRQYAQEHFDYSVIIPEYLKYIGDFQTYWSKHR